ncbi:hypothetical protein [Bradyrhizobium liaoningense]
MKQWWRRWTYEVSLAISDALWEVLVVQLAALLDRLTVRKVIAFIPVVILVLAYYHRIPIPPELMLIGDFLAYIDIFSVLILLGVLSRVTTILFVIKQAAARIVTFVGSIVARAQRLDLRHRRERGMSTRPRREHGRSEDDRPYGGVWEHVASGAGRLPVFPAPSFN